MWRRGFGCRVGGVASFDPGQVGGVVGVGGVWWDEGVVGGAKDAVGGGELVGHWWLQLGGGGYGPRVIPRATSDRPLISSNI